MTAFGENKFIYEKSTDGKYESDPKMTQKFIKGDIDT